MRLGAPMGFIDVGGGLGVDYNGTKGWGGHSSVNYSMQNYANDVVAALQARGVASLRIPHDYARLHSSVLSRSQPMKSHVFPLW